jgi:hypothetical protein
MRAPQNLLVEIGYAVRIAQVIYLLSRSARIIDFGLFKALDSFSQEEYHACYNNCSIAANDTIPTGVSKKGFSQVIDW